MPYIIVDSEACKGCHVCLSFCPKEQIRVAKKLNSKGYFPAAPVGKQAKCTGCALCLLVCPDLAIEVVKDE